MLQVDVTCRPVCLLSKWRSRHPGTARAASPSVAVWTQPKRAVSRHDESNVQPIKTQGVPWHRRDNIRWTRLCFIESPRNLGPLDPPLISSTEGPSGEGTSPLCALRLIPSRAWEHQLRPPAPQGQGAPGTAGTSQKSFHSDSGYQCGVFSRRPVRKVSTQGNVEKFPLRRGVSNNRTCRVFTEGRSAWRIQYRRGWRHDGN